MWEDTSLPQSSWYFSKPYLSFVINKDSRVSTCPLNRFQVFITFQDILRVSLYQMLFNDVQTHVCSCWFFCKCIILFDSIQTMKITFLFQVSNKVCFKKVIWVFYFWSDSTRSQFFKILIIPLACGSSSSMFYTVFIPLTLVF